MRMQTQQGFTLIELMIALTLGLIIIAAAVGIYIANYKTLSTQKSGSEMQSASMFGIQPLESRLRLANLGNESTSINDTTTNGGVVLKPANVSGANVDVQLVSKTAHSPSNTATENDQLTVQFTNVTGFAMYDCEGHEIAVGRKSIERYYVPEGQNALYCDAGQFDASGTLSGFGDDGVSLISNVDLFRYLLGVQSFSGSGDVTTNFYTADDYDDITGNRPPIISIKFGIIASGTTPISTSEGLSEFTLLGQPETLSPDVSKKFVRNTFETTTLLRNARVSTFNVENATSSSIK